MIRLGSKVFVVIATLMLGLVVPPALAAEDVPQRRDASSFDALLDGLQAKADRAMDAAIAAGERGNQHSQRPERPLGNHGRWSACGVKQSAIQLGELPARR